MLVQSKIVHGQSIEVLGENIVFTEDDANEATRIIIEFKKLSRLHYIMLLLPVFLIWGCVPELTKDCIDMTNTSST
jgi:hypothetical protein